MTSLDRENPFWQYSLSVYGKPGVAETCLQLQDQYGCNVNLLLLSVWAGRQGVCLSQADFAVLQDQILEFDRHTVQPLRHLRRQVSQQSALPPNWQSEIKQHLLSVELLTEQMEQALLYEALLPLLGKSSQVPSQPTQQNLMAYLDTISQSLKPDLLTLVDQLIQALTTSHPLL